MGDGADQATATGLDALLLHQMGECDSLDLCQHCAEEEEDAEKQIQKERKRARKKATRSAGTISDSS